MAATVGTVQELSSGRVRLGMGVGDSAVRMTFGRVATLAELRSAVGMTRGLLEHGKATHEGRDLSLAAVYPGTEIYLSGSGPKTLEAAGELGDGAIIAPGLRLERIDQTNTIVDRGLGKRRDGVKSVRRMLWVACSIRSTSSEAISDVRPFVASVLRHPLPFELSPELSGIRESIRLSYDFEDHMARGAGHADVLPDDVVKQFAIAGTPGEVGEALNGLRGLTSSRVDELALVLVGPDVLQQARQLISVTERVA